MKMILAIKYRKKEDMQAKFCCRQNDAVYEAATRLKVARLQEITSIGCYCEELFNGNNCFFLCCNYVECNLFYQ